MSTLRYCRSCQKEKPDSEFASTRGYLCTTCKDPDYERNYQKRYYQRTKAKRMAAQQTPEAKEKARLRYLSNPDKYKANNKRSRLKRQYNLTPEELESMKVAQDNQCAICSRVFDSSKTAHIDHCHTTGKVRGLLCHHCNLGLGHFEDNTETLLKAVNYLLQ